MSLADFKGKIPEHQRRVATVDLTNHVDDLVIELREPSLAQMADAVVGTKTLRIDHPDLTEDAAYHVVLLALMHVSPQADSFAEARSFYVDIAIKNEPLFALVRSGFYREFDWLSDLISASSVKKKT